jgi:hypothetical protein
MSAQKLDAMVPAEMLLHYLSNFFHEQSHDLYKSAYLPYSQSRSRFTEAEKRLKSLPDTEAATFPRLFLPAIPKVFMAQMRIERKLAALRVIEALRLHAVNSKQLPNKLDDAQIVAVPNDPGTDKPFEYHLDGQTATLISRLPGEPLEITGLRYRITLKK